MIESDEFLMIMLIITILLTIISAFIIVYSIFPIVTSFFKSKKKILKKILIIGIPISVVLILSFSYYRIYYENQTHEIYIKLEEIENEKKKLMNQLAKRINDEDWIKATSLENDVEFLFCESTYLIQEASKHNDNFLYTCSYQLKEIESLTSEYLKRFIYAYKRCPSSERTERERSIFYYCDLLNIT